MGDMTRPTQGSPDSRPLCGPQALLTLPGVFQDGIVWFLGKSKWNRRSWVDESGVGELF